MIFFNFKEQWHSERGRFLFHISANERVQMKQTRHFRHFKTHLVSFTLLCWKINSTTSYFLSLKPAGDEGVMSVGRLKQISQMRRTYEAEELVSSLRIRWRTIKESLIRNLPFVIHSTRSSALFWNTRFTSSGRMETSFVWISTKPLAPACVKTIKLSGLKASSEDFEESLLNVERRNNL